MLQKYTSMKGVVTKSNILMEERRLFGTIGWMKTIYTGASMEDFLKKMEEKLHHFEKLVEKDKEELKKVDEELATLKEELAKLEEEILKVSEEIKEHEHRTHEILNKLKRIQQATLKAKTQREIEMLERDRTRLLKELHGHDEAIKELKERYEELTNKEMKLLDKEMELEEKKAKLIHEKELHLRRLEHLMAQFQKRIDQFRHNYTA